MQFFAFLLYSNWPIFDQKWSKLGRLGHFLARLTDFQNFGRQKLCHFGPDENENVTVIDLLTRK